MMRQRAGDGSVPPVGGLQLWLDASDASTLYDATTGGSLVADDGQVARWEDKSGNGYHVTQGTTSKQPYRRVGEVNSLDALEFSGDSLNVSAGFSDPLTFFTVAVPSTTSGQKFVVDGASSGGRLAGYLVDTQIWAYKNTNGTTSIASGFHATAGAPYVFGCVVDGASSVVTVDGGAQSKSGNLTGATLGTLNVGSYNNGSNPWGGNILEVIYYDFALSDADRESVENYLGDKWGVTITHP